MDEEKKGPQPADTFADWIKLFGSANTTANSSINSGYTCASCGVWVSALGNLPHVCYQTSPWYPSSTTSVIDFVTNTQLLEKLTELAERLERVEALVERLVARYAPEDAPQD